MIKKAEIMQGLEHTKQFIKDSLEVSEVLKNTTSQKAVIEQLERSLKDVLDNIEILQSSRYQAFLLAKGFITKE
jgi:hypothetical protein